MTLRAALARAALAAGLALLSVLAAAPGARAELSRPADPVVVTGVEVPALLGAEPARIVAFAQSRRRRWRQRPVQVDERTTVDLGQVYGRPDNGVAIETYADPGTLTGADPDPTLDAGDEIALMARSAGRRARLRRGRLARPRGTRRGRAVQLRVHDPGDGHNGWLYLFVAKRGRLDPSAGRDLVDYRFELLSGPYPETYRFDDGPNPERSVVETRRYRLRFTDRWINDQLEIRGPGVRSADLLDRRKAQFAPGNCGRSTDTFSDAEGAFVVNRDGPVRAIRSYVGANSGPLTQREHVFYDRVERSTTFLRVHQIPGVIDFFDYAPTAGRMIYRSDTTPGDVNVDGVPEQIPEAAATWEQLSGPHGTLTHVLDLETDATGLAYSRYYLDDRTPNAADERQCTGDGIAYGASGLRTVGPIPNTDPLRSDPLHRFEGVRTIYYDEPGQGRADAVERARWAREPLTSRARRLRTRKPGQAHEKRHGRDRRR